MRYNLAVQIIFVILALGSALALVSEHPIVSGALFVLALALVYLEHNIVEYVRSA